MNPGDRPRRALLTVAGAVLGSALVATAVVTATSTTPAGAAELERFSSCQALTDWATASSAATSGGGEEDLAFDGAGTTGGPVADAARATSGTGAAAAPTGATNTVVAGVDELDLIDVLDDGRALVSAGNRLSIVSTATDELLANVDTGVDGAQVSYDPERSLAWVVGSDQDGQLHVKRVRVDGASLRVDGDWSVRGALVDARRLGDRLYVAATDGFWGPEGATAVPFEGGPVPCGDVYHPAGPSDPAATLLVALPADGDLAPTGAAEVVGSGQLVHVTDRAAYLATPLYGDEVQTSVHRFDLATLAPTGSGRVDGTLVNEFAMSEAGDVLRLAVSDTPNLRTEPMVVDGSPAPDGPPLNRIVVLDTDGALDPVGATTPFGKPGETLQGVRFDGTVAYAVTYLQTDPFYVVDLADPAAPRVVGEVELPGFSSYLHPAGDGMVVGIGPDDQGQVVAKLFDVRDRTAPRVVDTVELGQDSPVAWDHHALVDLGAGRFAVPATTYREVRPAGCTPQRLAELRQEEAAAQSELDALYGSGAPVDPAEEAAVLGRYDAVQRRGGECLYPPTVPDSSVAVLAVADGRLRLEQRVGPVTVDQWPAERVLPVRDGWALLAGPRWIVIGQDGTQRADLVLGESPTVYAID